MSTEDVLPIALINDHKDERYKVLVQLAKRYYKIHVFEKMWKCFTYPKERQDICCWFVPARAVETRCLICGAIIACFKPETYGDLSDPKYRQLIQHGINHLKEHNLIALI